MQKKTLVFVFFFALLLGWGGPAFAVVKYWIGPADGSFGNNLHWSLSSTGTNDTTAPGSGDIATFSADSTTNSTIDADVNVAGINITSGYTGVITQNSTKTVTVGSSNYVQANGTFTGGDSNIDINGAFTLSGGQFTSTTATLSVTGVWTHTSGGTFSHNNGTVLADITASRTWDVNGSESFYKFNLNGSSNWTLTIAAGDTFTFNDDVTFTNGATNTGFMEAKKNVAFLSGYDSGSSPLHLTGSANQELNLTGATALFDGNLTVNKSGGTVTLKSDLTMNVSSQDFIFISSDGTFDMAGYALSVADDFTQSGGVFQGGTGTNDLAKFTLNGGTFNTTSGTMSFSETFTHAAGTFNHTSGTVTADLTASSTWDFIGSQTFQNFTVNAASGWTLTIGAGDTIYVPGNVTFTNGLVSAGFIDVKGNVTVGSTYDGGTTPLHFTKSGDQTFDLTGGTALYNGSIYLNKASGKVTLLSNLTLDAASQDLIMLKGDFDVAGYALTVDDDFTQASGTFTGSTNTNKLANFTLNGGTFNATSGAFSITGAVTHTGGTFSHPTGTLTADLSGSKTWDLNGSWTVDTFVLKTTPVANYNLTISSGDTLICNGTITLTDGALATGAVEAKSHVTVGSAWDSNSVANPTPIWFTGTTDQNIDLTGATSQLNNSIIINKASGNFVVLSDLLMDYSGQDLELRKGTINMSNYLLTVADDFTSAGTFNGGAGTTYDLADVIISNGTFTTTSGTTKILSFTHTGSGTFSHNNGSVTFDGVASTLDVNGTETFYNVDFNGNTGTAKTIASGDKLIVTNDVTFTNGLVDTGTVEVRRHATVVAGYDSGSAPLLFAGSANQTFNLTGGTGLYNGNITVNKTGGTVTLASALTMDLAGQDLEINAGTLDMASYNLTVNDDTTMSGGTFTGGTGATHTLLDLTMNGGTYTATSGTTDIAGALTQNAGTFNHGNGTVSFSAGSFTYDVPTSITFNNMTLGGTNATNKTLSSGDTFIVLGKTTLNDGKFLGGTLECRGDITMISTYDSATTTTMNITGSSNQTIDFSGATGTWDADINVNKSGGTVSMVSDVTLNAANQDLIIQEGKLDINGNALAVNGSSSTLIVENGGTLQRRGGETVTANTNYPQLDSGSTVIYTGNGDGQRNTYTITTMAATYHHLTINSIDGNLDKFQLGANIDINGNLTITAGDFDVSSNNRTVTVGGNWANTGTFTKQAGTVTLDTTTAATISGSTVFNNLTCSTGRKALTFTAGTVQTVAGALTLTGTAGNLITLQSSATGSYWGMRMTGTRTNDYLLISDGDASYGIDGAATNSTDQGHNLSWFSAPANSAPSAPSSLGPANYVDGSDITDITPTFTFTTSDPDANDKVKYWIQIDDTSDFLSVVADYTSATATPGATSFTVGQAPGAGTYAVGSENQSLFRASYYWRVKAIDAAGSASAWTTANAGSIAFKIEPYVVTKTADTDDGTCDSDCSLREAITAANADTTTPNYVYFGIDSEDPNRDTKCSQPTQVCTMQPTSALPDITRGNLTIDGYQQAYASQNTNSFPSALNMKLRIVLDGSNAGGTSDGITINGVGNVVVKGLGIQKFVDDGVTITGAGASGNKIQGCIIGMSYDGTVAMANSNRGFEVLSSANSNFIGTDGDGVNDAAERNLISKNGHNGIYLDTQNNKVMGNFVGTDMPGQNDQGNVNVGIYLSEASNIIGTNGDGTSDSVEGNVISGNDAGGLGGDAAGNFSIVAGNYIGINAGGTAAIGNTGHGINFIAFSNTIGTNADGTGDTQERNIVSGNTTNGILITSTTATANVIAGNYIGTGTDGTTDVGNLQHGIAFTSGASNNTLGGTASSAQKNIIAYNGDGASEYGIQVFTSTSDGNMFYRNSVAQNQNAGIFLDTGSNNDKKAPTIKSQATNGNNLDITGTSDAASDTIELFDASSDSEGEVYLGTALSDGSKNWTITISSPYTASANIITATAGDTTNGTSAFSSTYTITNAAPSTPTGLGPTAYVDGSNGTDATPTLSFTTADLNNDQVKYQIQIDDSSDFGSIVLDYTSALGSAGASSFTVAQAAGSGTYNTGTADTALPYGSYYWRVKAIDASSNASGWATANGGSVAFVVKVYTVTKTADTNDGTCNTDCSLREAITVANADGYEPRNLGFLIPSSDGGCNINKVCTISPTSALPALSSTDMTIDGFTQPLAVKNTNATGPLNSVLKIELDGTSAGAGVWGFDITSATNTVKGISIYNFSERGINVRTTGTGSKIQGMYIGVKADGNTAGGVNSNANGGIILTTDAHYIGTDGDGASDSAERNLISANGTTSSNPAISIGTTCDDVVVAGNIIGLNMGGTVDLGNKGSGIYINGKTSRIGTNGDNTSNTTERNVISGNDSYGISFDTAATTTEVMGNYIGTDVYGEVALANTSSQVNVKGSTNTIGTDSDGVNDGIEGNVISGGGTRGIYLEAGGNFNLIKGNIIGLNAAGTGSVPNINEGIRIDSFGNTIGTEGDGTSDSLERNVISGNTTDGIRLQATTTTGNVIAGNYIGTWTDGTTDFGNGRHGIFFDTAGATQNTIGGDSDVEKNVIAYNGDAGSEYGIYVNHADADDNDILRNSIAQNQSDGIKLGTGGNNDQAVPTITSEACSGLDLSITGTSGASEVVQLFDSSSDSEGEVYLNQATADGSGNWSIVISSPYMTAANKLVATATNGTNGTSGFTAAYSIVTSSCGNTRKRIWPIF